MKNNNLTIFKKERFFELVLFSLFVLEAIFFLLAFLFSGPLNVFAQVAQNATVTTEMTIGTVYSEITNITIEPGSNGIDLLPNSTKNVTIYVIARDYDGEDDILNITARFFDNVNSFYEDTDSNHSHYPDVNCSLDQSYGTGYEVNATCIIPVWYYANNQTWNATVLVTDSQLHFTSGSATKTINQLLAVGVPDTIDYGLVNVSTVSGEKQANVTNFGNVRINLSLSGYARTVGDNLSMNCTLGSTKNISIVYEKYNLTNSNTSALDLSAFESIYRNLTSTPVIREFNLNYRQQEAYNDAVNSTYWRIYVPIGVAGSCQGNIVFGARVGPET